VARRTERVDRQSCKFFLHEHIVRVESRDGEDGDAVAGKRLDEGQQDSSQGERERAFEFQTNPAMGRMYIERKIFGWANDREFLSGTCDRGEFAFRGPSGDERVWGEADDGAGARESAEFEVVKGHFTDSLI